MPQQEQEGREYGQRQERVSTWEAFVGMELCRVDAREHDEVMITLLSQISLKWQKF